MLSDRDDPRARTKTEGRGEIRTRCGDVWARPLWVWSAVWTGAGVMAIGVWLDVSGCVVVGGGLLLAASVRCSLIDAEERRAKDRAAEKALGRGGC